MSYDIPNAVLHVPDTLSRAQKNIQKPLLYEKLG